MKSLLLMRNAEEERRVDFLAHQLGYKRVGLVLTHSNAEDSEREFNVSGAQCGLMAALQAEGGEHFVTAVVSLAETEEGEPYVHFELFQVRRERYLKYIYILRRQYITINKVITIITTT